MWDESPQAAPVSSTKKRKFSLPSRKVLLIGFLGLVIVVALIGGLVYFYFQSRVIGGNLISEMAAEKQIALISRLVDLPTNEEPTIATVVDKFKLNNQPFFAKAENGDQVLIYPKNKIGVLYRPKTGKIINYATDITVGGQTTTQTTPAPTVAGVSTAPAPSEAPTPTPTPTEVLSPTPAQTITPTSSPAPSPVN